MSKVLVVNDGKRERELLLVERLVVGRDPACDVSFDDGLLSRRHAEFVAAASAVTVRDLGSRNGIFVNGTRRAEQALKPGDVVQIGPLRVRYLHDRAAAPGAPSAPDADGTRMLAGPPMLTGTPVASPAAAPPPTPTPRPAPADVFRPAAQAPALDEIDDTEGETRVSGGGAFLDAVKTAAADVEATGFTPAPPRPATMPNIGSFVVVQLGALAVIVFVATVAPVVLSRGTVLAAVEEGSFTALLVWPTLPLVIGLTATLVIANVVNRRVLDAVVAARQHREGR